MTDTIKLFMWGFQKHMLNSLQYEAEDLFNRIDEKLQPKILLFGVLVEENIDRYKICIEPEDCGFNISAFTSIEQIAKELQWIYSQNRAYNTNSITQLNHQERDRIKAIMDGIKIVLDKQDWEKLTEKYISYPTYIEGYLVFTIIEINAIVANNYYSLTKKLVDSHFEISRSFLESTISIYLRECTKALKDPYRGFEAITRQSEEILRESGKHFMYTISQAGKNFDGIQGLYDTCNIISSMKYEGMEGFGKLAIVSKDHINLRLTLELEEPIQIRDYRKVRKFLELSTKDSIIVSDSALIYGLGELVGKYNPKEESMFIVNFISHFKWEILHDDNSMFVSEYGLPNIRKEKLNRHKIYSDIKRIFNDIPKRKIDDLWDIIMQVLTQKSGAMLVISSDAENEAKRLSKQCFEVKPMKFSLNLINQFSQIDGAILLDENSMCYAIGVILDGCATENGDSARGSRYNSAIRYFEQSGKESSLLIITVSEDGMIDVIPNLRAQIKHDDILKKIEELRVLNELEKVDKQEYYPIINWFEMNQFYLIESECNEINFLRKELEDKEEASSYRIIRNNLKPNKEMNESFYIKK